MSLQVWLPLNGDLHNQGLSKISVTNNGATINDNGKIGKCYSFNGSSSKLSLTSISTNNFNKGSICCWVKNNAFPASGKWMELIHIGTLGGFANCVFGMYLESTNGINISINGSSTGGNLYTHSLTTNTWYHLCAVYDGTTIKLYLNGNEVLNKTATKGSYTNTTSSIFLGATNNYYLNGFINDVRIYNHCLSAKEVKEISQGLILHYQLNNNINILTQYDKQIYTEPDNSQWLHIARHNNPGSSGYFTRDSSWETGVYIDDNRWYDVAIVNLLNNFEFMVKQKTTSSVTETKYRWIQSINPLKAVYNDVKPAAVTRITTTGYTDGSQGGLWKMNSSARLCIANANSSNWYGAIGSWTAYSNGIPGYPNTTITSGYIDLYVRIDNQFNIIYDTSGYNNNGSSMNILNAIYENLKYNMALSFNGNNNGILIENLELSNILNNQVTISFWIKPQGENGARSIYFGSYSSTSWSIEKTTGNVLRSYWNGTPDTTCTGATITDGIWQHICIVKNGTADLKVYINGILKFSSTATLSAKIFPTTYRIGRDTRSGDGTPYHGDMSDFRIYATALSVNDVLELYKTSKIINSTTVVARDLE